jgi:mono/diheme cytochrome c family protein
VGPRAVSPAAYSSIAAGAVPGQLTALKWDSESKEYTSKRGESEAHFTFWLTNITSAEVSINSVRTSCGCTVAKLPSTPWVVPPAGSGPIDVTVNLAGKSGTITKAVTVESTAGAKSLLVKVNIEGGSQPFAAQSNMSDADRLKNMQRSLADRQIVFKEQDCAKCHADPAKGQTDGRQVYAAVCSVCHDSHIRASMVPDLKTLTHPTDAEFWRNWINYGRAGSMMPAFAQTEGGPLSESQVNALVNFLVTAYPSRQAPGDLQKSAALRQTPVVSPAVAVPAH